MGPRSPAGAGVRYHRRMPIVVFCHGLESNPHGSKVQALRAAGFEVVAPDFQGQNLAARVETLMPVLRGAPDVVLVGSSYGGLAALYGGILHVAAGGRLRGLVLCAPALHWREPPADVLLLREPPAPTIVIHGRRDEVVPVAASEAWAGGFPEVELVLVDDEHRLKESMAAIVTAVRRFVDGGAPRDAA